MLMARPAKQQNQRQGRRTLLRWPWRLRARIVINETAAGELPPAKIAAAPMAGNDLTAPRFDVTIFSKDHSRKARGNVLRL
jgi:hypothetical protein